MLKSVIVLAHAMEDTNPGVRLGAARAAMSLGLKAFDLDELRRRLDRLDDALALRASRNPWP